MNRYKIFVLLIIFTSFLFPYSNPCGFPLILGFSTNRINHLHELLRDDEVGSISIFTVRNLSTNELEEIEFELLMIDSVSKFYGEVSELAAGNINLSTVEKLFNTFTSSTLDADSLNLQNGIRGAEETMLGSPPVINNDVIVNILLMDIRDNYSNSGEFVAGFFDPQDQFMCYNSIDCDSDSLGYYPTLTNADCNLNQLPNEDVVSWKSCGNGKNIIYIDSNPSKVNEDGLENTLFTLAHEYQHLLHWNADVKEGHFQTNSLEYAYHNPWINEGISDLMSSILGLGLRDFSHYLENPSIGLDEWSGIGSSSTLPYYAKSALFFQYLYELEGLSMIKNIFTDSEQGLESIKNQYNDLSFETLYIDWIQSLVVGKLAITYLNVEVYSENIENYISIGLQSALIETGKAMPEYSFVLFSLPDYLSTVSVNSNLDLNISLLSENVFFTNEDIVDSGMNKVEKIIIYTKDVEIGDVMFDIGYRYMSSPKKNNLFIFPNPITEDMLSYTYFGDEGNGELILDLFDLKGRKVLYIQSFADNFGNYNGEMNLNVSSGIYILKCQLSSGVTESKLISVIK